MLMLTEQKEKINILPNEIHLWCVNDESVNNDMFSSYLGLLNNEEVAQQKRLYFEKHRNQYLVTRALVRVVLSLYAINIKPSEWVFTKNEYGKPFIANTLLDQPIYFNLSHTEKMIVLAVSLEEKIGVDIEYLPRNIDFLSLAPNVFSEYEFQQLNSLPTNYQKDRFFDVWTLKEAYIKACGMGLSIPLNQFSYSFPEASNIQIAFDPSRKDCPEHWHLWCLQTKEIYDTHKLSLAVKNENRGVKYCLSMRKIIPLINSINHVDFSIVKST